MNKTLNKGGGILGTLFLLVLAIGILIYNEGRTVKMQSAINEALKTYVDVASDIVDQNNEGKLIATKGGIDLSASSPVKDEKFGISITGAKLLRTVEMYQWEENCTTDEDNVTTCTYNKVWSESINDSSSFQESGHDNPTTVKYQTEEYLANNVKVGAFDLPTRLLQKLSYDQDITGDRLAGLYKEEVDAMKLNGNYITNSSAIENPQIGDIRISYKVANDGEVSMLGVQKGNTLEAFTGKKGKTIFEIRRGAYTGREILDMLTKQNKMLKWILRAVGTILTIAAIGSIFAPLQRLANKVPILGSIVNTGTGLISTLLGLAISLIVIAIAWLRYRPILSLVLIAIAVILFILLKLNLGKSIKASAVSAINKEKNKIEEKIDEIKSE